MSDFTQQQINDILYSNVSDRNQYIFDHFLLAAAQRKEISQLEETTERELTKKVAQELNGLSDEQKSQIRNQALDMWVNSSVFDNMPPKLLAEALDYYQQQLQKMQKQAEQVENNKQAEELKNKINEVIQKLGIVEGRVADVTQQFINDSHAVDDLYFVNTDNVADVDDGYRKMFAAAEKYGILQTNQANEAISGLDKQLNTYLETFGLNGVTAENSKELLQHYDTMKESLDKVQLKDARELPISENGEENVTLGDLLDSINFSKGNKKQNMEAAEAIAKQLYVMNNLTADNATAPENVQRSLTEYLPFVLAYAYRQTDVTRQALENPERFYDEDFRAQVVDNFVSSEQKEIDDDVFAGTVYGFTNQAYAWRSMLARQLAEKEEEEEQEKSAQQEKNKDADNKENKKAAKEAQKEKEERKAAADELLLKVCRPLEKGDVRADGREETVAVKDIWKNYTRDTLSGMGSAFLGTVAVKGTLLATAGIAAATTGVAVASAMAVGSAAMGVGMTIKSYFNWRKEQKKQGKSAGIGRFVKESWGMLTSTGLTGLAIGAAKYSQPEVALALGGAALAWGSGRAAKNDYKVLRAKGVSKPKAALAAFSGAVLKTGTALLTNYLMGAWAQQHMTHHEDGKPAIPGKDIITGYEASPDLIAHAHSTLETFYGHDADALNHDLQQVTEQLKAMGAKNINPEVFLRNAIDAGMNTGVDTINHVDGGGVVHTHGNNLVLTELWAQEHGVNQNLVHALGDIKDADGNIHISADAIKGYEATKFNVSVINEVGDTSNTQAHFDGVLDRNASVNEETGVTVHDDKNPDRFETYADHNNHGYKEIHDTTPGTPGVPPKDTPVEDHPGVGMFGTRHGGWMQKIADRVGAFAAKFLGKPTENKEEKVSDDNKQKTEVDNKDGKTVTQVEKAETLASGGKNTSDGDEHDKNAAISRILELLRNNKQETDEVKTVVVPVKTDESKKGGDDKNKTNEQPATIVFTEEDKQNQDTHSGKNPDINKPSKTPEQQYMMEEFQIMYGYKPTAEDKQYKAYTQRVEAERQASADKPDMATFLKQRREAFDNIVEANIASYGKDKDTIGEDSFRIQTTKMRADFIKNGVNSMVVSKIRQGLWKTDMDKDAFNNQWTLTDFQKGVKGFLVASSDYKKSLDAGKANVAPKRGKNNDGRNN